jgi:hypothetical protein
MSLGNDMVLFWPPKDPAENLLDYDINWLPRLTDPRTGIVDTIASSAWAITVGDSALMISSSYFTAARTKVWLSGGTVGLTYSFRNTITTAAGDTEIETVKIRIRTR